MALNDDLGVQAGYHFRVVDEMGNTPAAAEFAGAVPEFSFRLPPQAVQIQRSIRAESLRDLTRGVSVVSGGEGIGRIVLQGTHGVGTFKESEPSDGRATRDRLVSFFSSFVAANEERGRLGKETLRMLLVIEGGKWSNPEFESYLVWPESFPADSRSAGRPHSWDWSCSLLLLRPWSRPSGADAARVVQPAEVAQRAVGYESALDAAMRSWKGAKELIGKARDLKNKLSQIRTRVLAFASGAEDAVYEVTDLVRGSSQLCREMLRALDPARFDDTASTALRGTLYDVRRLLGDAAIAAQQARRSGVIPRFLTAPRTASLASPVLVALSPGDSLQAIAARSLGDASRWPEIVKANGLEFPFVDFSGPGGAPGAAYAGRRVLGATDTVKVPLPGLPGVVAVADDPVGSDLPDDPAAAGALVGGTENLVAAILRRFQTPLGRIPWHPLYGSALPSMVGSAQTLGDVAAIRAEAIQNLKADPRVLGVQAVTVKVEPGLVQVSAEVLTPLGPLAVAGAVS